MNNRTDSNQTQLAAACILLSVADADEILRTWKIADYQQNKPNPFVLDESLIVRSFFEDEFILGDINGDGNLNVLDVVELINQILSGENTTEGDINGDGGWNVLDIVALANCVLSDTCFNR